MANKTVIGVRVDPIAKSKIKEIAENQASSPSQLINLIIQNWLKQQENKECLKN